MKCYLTLGLFFASIFHLSAQNEMDKAQDFYDSGEYREVLQVLHGTDAPEGIFLIADAYHKMEMLDSALTFYYMAEDAGYEEGNLFLHRGICQTSLELTQGAEDDLLTYYINAPEDERVHYYLAAVDYIDHNLREALFHLGKAIEINPSYMEAHYLKAAVFMEQNKMISALETFEFCAKLNPEFTRSKLNIAITQYEMMHYEEAETILQEIISADDRLKAEALFYLGNVQYALHQSEMACNYWKQAEKLGDNYAADQVLQICVKGNKRMVKRKTTASF
jgi:tetratricopeptide (TPR) repeat protein